MACPRRDRTRARRNPMSPRLARPSTAMGIERCAGAAGCSTRGGRRRAVDVCLHRPATMALVEERANAHRRVIAQSQSALGERLWRRSRGASCEGGRWPAMERALVLAGPERPLVLGDSGRHRPGGDHRVAGHRWAATRSGLSPGERFIAHNATHHAPRTTRRRRRQPLVAERSRSGSSCRATRGRPRWQRSAPAPPRGATTTTTTGGARGRGSPGRCAQP